MEEALGRASLCLNRAGIDNSRFDAELLLAYVLRTERLKLLLERRRNLTVKEIEQYRSVVLRRCAGEPVAYITGCKEFYGRIFEVNRQVLIPRPESELIVDLALEWAANEGFSDGAGICCIDLGTGSGNLAITLACALPQAIFAAVEISLPALKVASRNAERYGVNDRITWINGDYFEALDHIKPRLRFNLIVGNPPYIRSDEYLKLPRTVKNYEPRLALYGGENGLDSYRRIFNRLPDYIKSPALVALEIGAGQLSAIEMLCREHKIFHSQYFKKDYQGWPRVLVGLA